MKQFILILFLLIGFKIFAQYPLNYPNIDKITYQQYLQSDWKSLIETGKKSIDAGIDFYYLQVRMGIAYFMQNRFRQSIKYLDKAYNFNPTDEFVAAYLYKAYLYSGREQDARKLTNKFSETLKNKLRITENSIFSGIYVETKFDNWEDYQIKTNSTDVLEQTVRNKYSYFSLNFEHLIKSDKRVFWGYTGIQVLNSVYKLNEVNVPIHFEQNLKQNQLYFNYSKQYKRGINFSFGINYIFSNFDDYTLIPTRMRQGGGGSTYGLVKVNSNQFAASISFSKDISLFKLGINNSLSNFNQSIQLQPGLSIYFYPFGNTNLFLCSKFAQQFDFGLKKSQADFVYKQGLGFRISKFYIEPYMSWGKMANYTESNAFVIYNENDFIQDKKGVKLYAYLFKNKLNLYAEYQTYNKINTYKINGIENQINYNYQTIIGGIKWNF